MTRSSFTNLNPDEYNQGLCEDPFMVTLGRCIGNCNTLDNPFGSICVPNKTENVNINAFNMIIRINESK